MPPPGEPPGEPPFQRLPPWADASREGGSLPRPEKETFRRILLPLCWLPSREPDLPKRLPPWPEPSFPAPNRLPPWPDASRLGGLPKALPPCNEAPRDEFGDCFQSQTHEAFRRRLLSFAGESVFTLYTTYGSSVAAMYTSVKASEGTERQPLRTRVCHVLLFRSEVISETC